MKKQAMKDLLVIHEKDLSDNKQTVIGVADSVENAEKIINEYYGDFKELNCCVYDTPDSGIEYAKELEVKGAFVQPYRAKIWLEWFILNRAQWIHTGEVTATAKQQLAEGIKRLPKEKREEIVHLLSEVSGRINSIEFSLIGTELERHSLYINGTGSCPTLWCEVFALEKLFRDAE